RQVSILRRGVERVVLQIGSGQAWIQSAVVPLDAPPYLRNGRTMLPLRFISEAFGAEVHWNEQARRVTILDAPSKETAGEDVHQGAPQPGSEEPDPGEVPNAGNDKVVRV